LGAGAYLHCRNKQRCLTILNTNPAQGRKKTHYNMNNLRNKVQLIGRLGQDPEVKHLEGGKTVANFSLATNYKFKNKQGEWAESTDWHNLVAWGKTAEIIEKYVLKGSEIGIEGRLTTRSWDDKDGNKRYTTEVLVNELMLMGSIQNGAKTNGKAEKEDDLPF
jgi:single-strand DNA-binding protein